MKLDFVPVGLTAAFISIAFSAGTYFYKFDQQSELVKKLDSNYTFILTELLRIEDHLKMKPKKGE